MPNLTLNLTETAIRLYRQLFGSPGLAGQLADGIETVLDGNTAIAVTEACISEVAALSHSFLSQTAALAWLAEQQRVTNNLFDQPLSVQQADSPRGALASAIGVCQSGHRSSVFLGTQDLSACQDLLQTAAGRHLPLVIHIDNQLSAAHSNTDAAGHEALHQAMDSGCIVLFAANVQQAVDFTLIARHVAEISLTPAIVVMDSAETALSAQNVRLPSLELVQEFIGRADELIKSPSIVQKQLFAEQRRRVPNWHNLDKPVLQGAMQDGKLFALGRAAGEVYFDEMVSDALQQAFNQYRLLTAREYSSVSSFGLKKADLIIIAQGSAIETLTSLSHYLQGIKKNNSANLEKINLGVIGLHCLRPFAGTALTDLLSTMTKPLIVLERMNTPLSDNAPLMREIRACLHQQNKAQQLHSVIYGLGGSELVPADCYALCEAAKNNSLKGKYLGIPFISYDIKNAKSKTKETHPKRQVMLDTLERYYPHISKLGITNVQGREFSLNSGATSLSYAISYIADSGQNVSYAMDLAAYLHLLHNNNIRTSISSAWQQWAQRQTDYISQSDTACAASSTTLVDYFLLLSGDSKAMLSACEKLAVNGTLIFNDSFLLNAAGSQSVISAILHLIQDKNLSLYKVSEPLDGDENKRSIWEEILAALIALQVNKDQLNLKTRKIISLRESMQADWSLSGDELFKNALNAALENNQPYQAEKQLRFLAKQVYKAETASETPEIVKHLGQGRESYDSLPRFWDQTGLLQQQGNSDQLTADPYLATGTIPSLSAAFNDLTAQRNSQQGKTLPVFNAQSCIACGDCWSNCPDSAIAIVAVSPKKLIETAINASSAEALRSVSSKLASQIARRCRNNEVAVSNAGDVLQDAFARFKEKASFPEERMQTIEADFNKACNAVADLPIVLSESLFYAQEKQQNDSGELFSLVINPQSCKACGLCVELCVAQTGDNEHQAPALSNREQHSDNEILYRKQWSIWQQIPDTPSATIERLLKEQTIPAGSALMMSRHNAFALSGGDQAEPASGEKIAMRQLLSAAEYQQQPLIFQFISELERVRNELKTEINHSLAEALPTDNLNLLAEKLSDIKTRQVDLNSLLEQNETVMDEHSIDAMKTRELVDLVLALNDLHWKLSEGVYGLGRARYSLCISSSSIASWAGSFPHNPFHVPVNIDTSGESAQVAMGLMKGQICDLLSAVSLMRQAKAAIDARYAKQTDKLDNLNWQDLTPEEQQLCPPLFLVGGDDMLGSHGFSQIALLLNSPYPVKVIIFNELDSGLATSGLHQYRLKRRQDSPNNLAMMAISQKDAYVAQTSIADNDHFQQSVQQLLANNNAGLINIHTPSPQRHGFAAQETVKQAELALYSGMFPLFQYNPQDEGVFGSRLSLHDVAAQQSNDLNPVHWAINEQRFQAHFSDLEANAKQPIELSDWIKISAQEQHKKTPFVIINSTEDEQKKIAVSRDFATMIAQQQDRQRVLQELAGIVTPFTDYVEACVAERLSDEHQAELDALQAEYEAKIKQLDDNYNSQTHTKIRNQLLGLAGYDATRLN